MSLIGIGQAEPPRLSLPLDCTLGLDCLVQQYVDLDAGPGVADPACAARSYDGHKGTDFRVNAARIAREDVAVFAAAPGVVLGLRDGEPDRAPGAPSPPPDALDKACGNGVLIDHGAGWATQYCHLKRGSLRVRKGEQVARGQQLGAVGRSGATEFAHLHIGLSKDRQVVDPFTGASVGEGCGQSGASLWDFALAYREAALIDASFSARALNRRALARGEDRAERLSSRDPALVFWAQFAGLRAGDVIALTVIAPDGAVFAQAQKRLPRDQAEYLFFAGKKRRADPWPGGRYEGRAVLIRKGREILKITRPLSISR
ncbi:MAG: M23 family metallopeptidase [Neomegalonema sp.]|nr:M23 family metallopeptidase [Neomegalonema sp.]